MRISIIQNNNSVKEIKEQNAINSNKKGERSESRKLPKQMKDSTATMMRDNTNKVLQDTTINKKITITTTLTI